MKNDDHATNNDQMQKSEGSVWPEFGLERVSSCPVCSSSARTLLYKGLTDRVFLCAPGEWTLHRCGQCCSAYLDPRPTVQTIHLAYSRYFTHLAPKCVSPRGRSSAVRRWRIALANGYCNWRYASLLKPATRLGVVVAWFLPAHRERIDRACRYLPRSHHGARLLDIGAGNGAFLERARDLGWEAIGVEPDETAVEFARSRGLNVRVGGIEQIDEKVELFDAITLSHVIEHVHDPRLVISRAHALLKPGGCLFIDTPNIESRSHRKFGSCFYSLDVPRHLLLFNWSSLEALLRATGFESVTRRPAPGVHPHIVVGSRAIQKGRDPKDKMEHQLRMLDHLFILGMRAWLPLFYKRSEYVTVTAYKAAQ